MQSVEGEMSEANGDEIIEFIMACKARLRECGSPPECVSFHPDDWDEVTKRLEPVFSAWGMVDVSRIQLATIVGLKVRLNHFVPRGQIHIGMEPELPCFRC